MGLLVSSSRVLLPARYKNVSIIKRNLLIDIDVMRLVSIAYRPKFDSDISDTGISFV
jgi:hypothetical protein